MNHNPSPVAGTVFGAVIKRIIAALLVIIILSQAVNHSFIAKADTSTGGSQVNVSINFIEETATISAGPGKSTKFYISTDNMKSWEGFDKAGAIDISSFMSSKAVTIYFKGNKDVNPVKVEIPAEDKSLKVKYEVVNGEGRIAISNTAYPVEYRKGSNGSWKSASNYMSTSIYELKGATLYFRIAPTVSMRAGKVVTVKIPKRPSGPSVSLDTGKLCIKGLKSGQTQYRVGDAVNWTTFTAADKKTNSIDLSALLTPVNNLIPAGIIEFRTMGSDKKVHSAVKTIEILQQGQAPNNVALSGSVLTITDSDLKRYYEYAVVSGTSAIDVKTLKWISVTAKKPVYISKVNVGDRVLVRLKSTKSSDKKHILLPSAYKEFTVKEITTKK